MITNTLFFNELGRQGKSTLAYNFYDFMQRKGTECSYITNDMTNISFPVKKLVGKQLIVVKPGDEVTIDTENNNIFDFGGYLDNRVVDVAQYVDHIIVPISYASNSELKITAKTIKSLIKYNSSIVIVFNKTKKEKINRGIEMLGLLFDAYDIDAQNIKIFKVSESEYMTRLSDMEQSIYDVADAEKRDRTQLEKKLIPQISELYNYIIN
jgi:hypothetical protein